MVQVDFIDYGLGWEKLKKGQSGNTICFEITDFKVSCDEEMLERNRQWEQRERVEKAEIEMRRARHKMRNRIKRIIMGNYFREKYWLPNMVHGRVVLALLSKLGYCSLNSIDSRMGAYVVSLAISYCLRDSLLS